MQSCFGSFECALYAIGWAARMPHMEVRLPRPFAILGPAVAANDAADAVIVAHDAKIIHSVRLANPEHRRKCCSWDQHQVHAASLVSLCAVPDCQRTQQRCVPWFPQRIAVAVS